MLRHPHTQTSSNHMSDSTLMLWLGVALAVIASIAYVLIGQHLLAVGDLSQSEEPLGVVYFTAGSYFVGGVLILLRRRWLWLFGAIVNAMVITFFFQLYENRPAVLFSPGGIATKAAQILLELVLVYLLIADWHRSADHD